MWADVDDQALTIRGTRNTDMPWRDFSGMTREDLSLIYTYLRTVPSVNMRSRSLELAPLARCLHSHP